jgi:DNA-binding CsgD family transcriptional regulator
LIGRRQREQSLAARQPGFDDLTPAERRILRLVAAGQSSKEIANALFVH